MTRGERVRTLSSVCYFTRRYLPALLLSRTNIVFVAALSFADVAALSATLDSGRPTLPAIVANDNQRAAGSVVDGVLALDLRAGLGLWRPDGESGPALQVEAFGEAQQALSVPSPLIRVTEGTEIAVTLHNELPTAIRVHGLCDRGGSGCAPLEVAAGAVSSVRFRSGPAGTYHYWATTTGMPISFRAAEDAQLSGAFIVDPPGATRGADRVLVLTEWTSLTRNQLMELIGKDDPGAAFLKLKPEGRFLINGLSWPHTERLTYRQGERVHWRVLNLSTQSHPLHLHGFYFEVDSLGDGARDRIAADGRKQRVVTQLMAPGTTMAMTWTPERVGNWLLHCHVMTHVSATLAVDGSPKPGAGHHEHADVAAGMAGMVLGITVLGAPQPLTADSSVGSPAARRLAMSIEAGTPRRHGSVPVVGFRLIESGGSTPAAPVTVPGPTLVLERGEPVEITLVNKLAEGTAIHWHGMELESYYDGVHGWSGAGGQVTPLIEPGGSFVVRFTPPRAGTFMYHTHLHDQVQLTSGMYGALLVVEPDTPYDETADHVLVIGRDGPEYDAPTLVNGRRDQQIVWKAGLTHRVRLINITPGDIFSITLQTSEGPVTWRPLAKDGASLDSDRCVAGPAKQLIAVGETYDFEYQAPQGRRTLWLEVRSPAGKWHTQAQIIVR